PYDTPTPAPRGERARTPARRNPPPTRDIGARAPFPSSANPARRGLRGGSRHATVPPCPAPNPGPWTLRRAAPTLREGTLPGSAATPGSRPTTTSGGRLHDPTNAASPPTPARPPDERAGSRRGGPEARAPE